MTEKGVFARFKTSLRAHAAAVRYGRPSKKMQVILVAGVDGASGTVAFLASILRASGASVGVATRQYVEIGRNRVEGSDQADINNDAFRLQALLAQIKRAKCQYAIIEVLPELPPHQFVGLKPTMIVIRRCGDNYIDRSAIQSRLAMLDKLLALGPESVVFNKDDTCTSDLSYLSGQDGVISFGTDSKAECQIAKVELHPKGSAVRLLIDHQIEVLLTTVMTGRQTIYNAAAASAAAYVLRVPLEAIEKGVRTLPQVPAQSEYLPVNRIFQVVLDGSMSPGGLAETLETLKHFAKNRLIVVLGVPLGGTAPAKLGEVACSYADRLIICDGEYDEHQAPDSVRAQLMQGVIDVNGDAKTEQIADRRAAIEKATGIARRGDVVVLAAITQHPYRQLGKERIMWSDRNEIMNIFEG